MLVTLWPDNVFWNCKLDQTTFELEIPTSLFLFFHAITRLSVVAILFASLPYFMSPFRNYRSGCRLQLKGDKDVCFSSPDVGCVCCKFNYMLSISEICLQFSQYVINFLTSFISSILLLVLLMNISRSLNSSWICYNPGQKDRDTKACLNPPPP